MTTDFEHFVEEYLADFESRLSESNIGLIREVERELKDIPSPDLKCHDDSTLERDSWQAVRFAAARALSGLGIPAESPPPYKRVSHDVWTRDRS